jgi:hypothetical protein
MSYRVPEKSDYYYDESTNPIEEICKYTDNLEYIPPEMRYQMLSEICRQKGSSVYGHYDAPPNKHIVAQINGESGYFLKKTTAAANIYLIWYNPRKERYMFWGPSERSVRDAMNRIRGRIVKYVVHLDRQSERAYETAEDVDEMDYVEPVPPTFDEQFGKSSQKLMNKMGFTSGKGLGRNESGRTVPINPVKDLGGRMENRHYGLGYTKPAPKEAHAEQDFGTDKAIEIMMKHNPGMNEEEAEEKLNEMVSSVVVEYV